MSLKDIYYEHSQSEDKRDYDDATMLAIYNENLNKYGIYFSDANSLKMIKNEIKQVDPDSHQGELFRETAELIQPSKWFMPPNRISMSHFDEKTDRFRGTIAELYTGWYRIKWFDGSTHFWAPGGSPSRIVYKRDSNRYIFGGERKALKDFQNQKQEIINDINREIELITPMLTKEQGYRLMGTTIKGQEMAVYYSLVLYRDGFAYYSDEWAPSGPVNTQGKHYSETDFTEQELVKEIKKING